MFSSTYVLEGRLHAKAVEQLAPNFNAAPSERGTCQAEQVEYAGVLLRPSRTTFCARSTKTSPASSRTAFRSTLGWK